jgi:hypothetical protein
VHAVPGLNRPVSELSGAFREQLAPETGEVRRTQLAHPEEAAVGLAAERLRRAPTGALATPYEDRAGR